MKPVTVATFNDVAHAEELNRRLVREGVLSVIHDESKLERIWFVTKPFAGVRIEVPPEEVERATKLIAKWDKADNALQHAVRCPECGQSRIEYPQFTRKFLTPNLLGLLSAMHFIDKEFYCQDCHFTWLPEGGKRPDKRKHLGPNYFIEGMQQSAKESKSTRDG
jgi:hypothetical protein